MSLPDPQSVRFWSLLSQKEGVDVSIFPLINASAQAYFRSYSQKMAEELRTPYPEVLAFVDVETSGLDHGKDHLLEIACLTYDIQTDQVIEAKSWLFAAPSNSAEFVNGIPPALLTRHGRSAHHVALAATELASMLNRSDAVLAWNVAFDKPWIEDFFEKNLSPLASTCHAPWLCAMDDLTWPRRSSSRSLSAVALAHEVGLVDAHRALPDIWTMARLFRRASELGMDHARSVLMGLRPKAKYEAIVSYLNRDLAKQASFRWDDKTKKWTRSMFRDEVHTLAFEVRELIPFGKTWNDTHQNLRVLVAGGKGYEEESFVHKVLSQLSPRKILTSNCDGADAFARGYAASRGVAIDIVPVAEGICAEHRAATLLSRLTSPPELVVAFPGSEGTENLVTLAREMRIEVIRPVKDERVST